MNDTNDRRSTYAAAMLMEKLVRDIYAMKGSGEIQPLQWSILRYLATVEDQGCTMSKISGFLGVTHAPVVRAINTLVRRGLVCQRSNPQDARSKLLSLTPKGIAKMAEDPILRVVDYMESQPQREREQFKRFVRNLVLRTEMSEPGDNGGNTSDR
jgi:DNA-binding MarR family transcriptional regulator